MRNLGTNPILSFASAMQKELDENSYKGKRGWKDNRIDELVKRAKQELEEVIQVMIEHQPTEVILSECADVGNFMMMVADIYSPSKQ